MSCSTNETQVNNLCYSCPTNTVMIKNMCYTPCQSPCMPSTQDPTKCVTSTNQKCDVRQSYLPNVRPIQTNTTVVPTITASNNCPTGFPNLIDNKCYADCVVSDYSSDYCVDDSGNYSLRPNISLK